MIDDGELYKYLVCSFTKNGASLSYHIHIRILPFSSIDIMFFNRFIIIHSSCKIYLANCPIRVWSLGNWMYTMIIVLKHISSYIFWYLITMCNKFQWWWLNRYNARNKKHLIISFNVLFWKPYQYCITE